MNYLRTLDLLEEMDLAVGRLYRFFAERLEGDAEAATLFFRMSLEENSHASLIRYQRRIPWQNPDLFAPSPVDVEGVEKVIGLARERVAGGELPSVEEAVAAAANIEADMAELHYRFAVQPSEVSFGQVISRLGLWDWEHAKRLVEFAHGRGLRVRGQVPSTIQNRSSA